MYYCNVVNQEILAGPRPLPSELTPETAIENNWYPTVFLNMPHQLECNTFLQLIQMRTRVVGTTVECWHEVVNKTADDVEATRILLLQFIREERNKKLLYTDWTQLPNAAGLTQTQKDAWEQYRQQLRDFPNVVDLSNIQWPTEPNI